jgi:hypothetical protein
MSLQPDVLNKCFGGRVGDGSWGCRTIMPEGMKRKRNYSVGRHHVAHMTRISHREELMRRICALRSRRTSGDLWNIVGCEKIEIIHSLRGAQSSAARDGRMQRFMVVHGVDGD